MVLARRKKELRLPLLENALKQIVPYAHQRSPTSTAQIRRRVPGQARPQAGVDDKRRSRGLCQGHLVAGRGSGRPPVSHRARFARNQLGGVQHGGDIC
jgi:hypothetical protein